MIVGLAALRRHRKFEIDLASLFEFQRRGNLVAFLVRLVWLNEHQVIATGFQLNRFASWNIQAAVELAHLHDLIFHAHFMDFNALDTGCCDAHQLVCILAVVFDGKEAASNFCTWNHGAD